MLLKYPAGSICGSGVFGSGMLGIIGEKVILEAGVIGDLREDWEELKDWTSARMEEFFLEESLEDFFSFLENRPILTKRYRRNADNPIDT